MNDQTIKAQLQAFLQESKRIAVLGIGNDLRTDDGLGIFIINTLDINHPDLLMENVGSVPEAFARPLAEFGADRVIMIDAADMRKPPGHMELITKDRIAGVALSTHSMPLSLLMSYLEEATKGQTILLGIQPQSILFGEGLTPEIRKAAESAVLMLREVLMEYLSD